MRWTWAALVLAVACGGGDGTASDNSNLDKQPAGEDVPTLDLVQEDAGPDISSTDPGSWDTTDIGTTDLKDEDQPVWDDWPDNNVDGDMPCEPGCQPNCDGKNCGPDGCGGICGYCGKCGETCESGTCLFTVCQGKECGDDGCGGECGTCDGGKQCQAGACVCAVEFQTDCCGDAVCWFDSCGKMGDLLTLCPFGCLDGACLECIPDPLKNEVVCCDDALCWLDSCGNLGDKITDCPDGCKAGECIQCFPDCVGKECGPDGCGGQCGECDPTMVCDGDAQCVCTTGTDLGCKDSAIFLLDSCGNPVQKITDCPYGCDGGECLECVPDCYDKFCGTDGCGGTCGSCPNGLTCQNDTCVGDMVLVPAGTFWKGCPSEGDWGCLQEDSLPAFYIDRYEVTQGEYYRCKQAGFGPGCNVYEAPPPPLITKAVAELPVIGTKRVSNYCEWMGKRYCEVAEWEKAARGTDKRTYPWGEEPPTCSYAVMPGGCPPVYAPDPVWEPPVETVGSRPEGMSPYGVHDMIGNAAEFAGHIMSLGVAGCYKAVVKGGGAVSMSGPLLWGDQDLTISGLGEVTNMSWCMGSDPAMSGDLAKYAVGFRCCKDVE